MDFHIHHVSTEKLIVIREQGVASEVLLQLRTEVSTKVRNFEVQAKCAPLFHGTPTATACLKHSQARLACKVLDVLGIILTVS